MQVEPEYLNRVLRDADTYRRERNAALLGVVGIFLIALAILLGGKA